MRRAPRRLIVLASLDVAGFTRLMEHDERGTLQQLGQIRRHILRKSIGNHSGNLFKTMGDGALVEFGSVEDGVEWAIEFQTLMTEHNLGRANPIPVRVGVSLADVFVQGNDRFGAAVGFVTGVQQVAPPGGIAITHSVRWQLVKPLADQFDRTQFKNVDDQYELWLWRKPGDTPAHNRYVGIGHRPSQPTSAPRVEEVPRWFASSREPSLRRNRFPIGLPSSCLPSTTCPATRWRGRLPTASSRRSLRRSPASAISP